MNGRLMVAACAAVLSVAALAGQAAAHGIPADIAVWGGFNPATVRCQRAIARAATLCASRALSATAACSQARLGGAACDDTAREARIQAARARARDLVAAACDATQLQTLRYLDLNDAQTDVIDVCRQVDTAAVTAAFGPAMVGGTVAAVEATTGTCIAATARASAALLRYAMRARQKALDRIAATPMPADAKTALIERSAQGIRRARTLLARRIAAACPADTFPEMYGEAVETRLARIASRADCVAQEAYVQNAVTCAPPTCGDGMQELPAEECDDGNDYDGDGCRSDCVRTECDVFPTTFDLIQQAIFERRGCTNDICHGLAQQGGLDLRPEAAYAHLVDVTSPAIAMKRIDPGSKDTSLLWLKLAAKTYPDDYDAPIGSPMPSTGDALTPDELEALAIWIEGGGAARAANVPAAAALLDACVPEPKPVKIDPLEPPAPGTGVQFHMPAYTLPGQSETEVCYASYYDLSGQIPPALLSEDGERFRYKSIEIRQDPLSHHLIVDVYRGDAPANDPRWGTYTCKGGPQDGAVCDPLDLGACGSGECATDPDASTIACIGFGPTAGFGSIGSGGFAFAQETTAHFRFPLQVYDELPVKGVLLWNSHAFNLTREAGTLEAWVNIYFPAPEEQEFPQQQIFNTSRIFWNPNFPPVPPLQPLPAFEAMDICQVHEFGPNPGAGGSLLRPGETAHLFELSGHMHRHGKRFDIYRGQFTCAGGPNAGTACSPRVPEMCPASACVDAGGRAAQDALLYTNFVYNDPYVLRLDPPIAIDGDAPRADRTLTYCAYYDNGTPPNIQDVKRRSTSPPGGAILGALVYGGPCAVEETRCIGGPNHNALCNGDDSVCESSPGAGDGDCDACPLTGGFRTEDEMFILFGNYWVSAD